jgi:hypothetical protein
VPGEVLPFDHCLLGRTEGGYRGDDHQRRSREHADSPSAADRSTGPSGAPALAAAGLTHGRALDAACESLRLTVQHPAKGICVITVDVELDMYTTPQLEACLKNNCALNRVTSSRIYHRYVS